MVRQQPGVPPPSGNGHNGDGRRDEQDVEGMGGRLHFEGTLSDAERERLTADVVYWGLQQSRQGRLVSEEMLQAEFDRRLRSLELRREQPATEPSDRSDPSKAEGATSRPVVSRRNALKLIGLLGLQGATAVGTVELVDLKASQAASPASNHVAPSGVIAAGGSGPVDGSADTNVLKVNQPVLAAFNNGRSLFSPFPGPLVRPNPVNLALLHPPPPLPAQAGRVRQFTLTVVENVIDLARGVRFSGWMYNGTVPGPVIRVTQGDIVQVTLDNTRARHPHSVHFHGIHSGLQDGVAQVIPAGRTGTYTFQAEPFGLFPYYCHLAPLDQHVSRGLYGMLIVDPPTPRPPANEMAMLLNGYDLTFTGSNVMYSVNGMPGYYQNNPIPLRVGQPNRVYLLNMTAFDELNSFHLHGNMFNYIPAGTSRTPSLLHDVVHLGFADRGILEFAYRLPGQYLFHAHQTELSLKGWSGTFSVS